MNHCLNGSSISNDYRIVSPPCKTTSGGCTALRMRPKRPPLQLHVLALSHPHHSSPDTPPFLGCSKPPSLFLPYNLCFPPPIPFWHLLLQAHHTTSFVTAFCSTHHLLQDDVSNHKMQSTHHRSSPRCTLFHTIYHSWKLHLYTFLPYWNITSSESPFKAQGFSLILIYKFIL